ncbi:hypothetical protein GCM10025781_27100 [Kocuria gwangalliensis]|uniref:Uncharacterized protein n=1 Tax=Kocuria gwangalliensis TaxID=501592 RepID=A0ABP8XGC6_9MICC
MPDLAQYHVTQIDWAKLRRYAQRVARETKLPPSGPVTRTERVEKDVPVEKKTGGFFGFGARTRTVMERRKVEEAIEVVGSHWVLNRQY